MPSLHQFTYDADFYMADGPDTQAMEFDINWFMHSVGITWGTECRVAGGNEWDIWDNVNAHWIPTGIACNPVTNGWNHVTVAAERGPNTEVIYKSHHLERKGLGVEQDLRSVPGSLQLVRRDGELPDGWRPAPYRNQQLRRPSQPQLSVRSGRFEAALHATN